MSEKHAISSMEFKAQMQGFRDGSSRKPINNVLGMKEYETGYKDGQHAHRIYSEHLCKELGLVDPIVKLT